MPVVNTGGFQVAERPRVDLMDPRLIAPAYSNIIPALNQGLATYGNFQQVADDAQMRPIKQQMAQIQLQEAQAKLANLPMEQQIQLARLAEIQQNAAVPQQIIENIDITGGDTRKSIADLSVPFEQIQITEDVTPRVKVITGTDIGPGGAKTPFTKRETLASPQQVRAEQEKAALLRRSTEALATQRERGKSYEYEVLAEKERAAREAGDDELADIFAARLKRLTATSGIEPMVTGAREVEKIAARVGIPVDKAAALAAVPEGARWLSKMDSIKKYIAASGSSYVPAHMRPTPQEEAVMQSIVGAGSIPSAPAPVVSIARPKNKAERDALPTGTQYIGPDGQTYIKK